MRERRSIGEKRETPVRGERMAERRGKVGIGKKESEKWERYWRGETERNSNECRERQEGERYREGRKMVMRE